MSLITSIPSPNGAYLPVTSNQQLADAFRTISLTGALSSYVGTASGATYTWTTAKVVQVTHDAATCNITIPSESAQGLIDWPVGEVRSLLKMNTSVNVIGVTALTNVGYNLAAVNTAITTLIGSATVPGIATGLPNWNVYRASAISYLFWQGVG